MDNQCYYCEQIFDSKDKLYEHLEVHSKPKSKTKKTKSKKKEKLVKEKMLEEGESVLSEDEIMEMFNQSKMRSTI